MVKAIEKKDLITGEKSLVIDKRTLDKTKNPPNVKSLRYARNLPPRCNQCPYRSEEEGGNGICTVYKKDSVCIIRKDLAKIVDKFDGERDSDKVLLFMQSEFEGNAELLAFFEQIEHMSSTLDPEVTKRINALNNLGKTLHEMKTRRESTTITKTEELSPEMKQKITETINLTKDVMQD